MMGCTAPDSVSSPEVSVGRGGRGLLNCDSVGDAERMLAGYTGRRARVDGAWSGGGASLKDLRVAASLSSSSSRTVSISLIDLFQLAKTSSEVRPSAELFRALNSSVKRPSASETSSRTKMWDAGNMPMKTCCNSSARAEGFAADEEDGSEEGDQLTCGRRDVHTTYLEIGYVHENACQVRQDFPAMRLARGKLLKQASACGHRGRCSRKASS